MNQTTLSSHLPACLVTGGTSGIGLAVALKFAAQGYRIAICGRRAEFLNAAKQLILDSQLQSAKFVDDPGDLDQRCLAVTADMSDPAQALDFGRTALEQMGSVDVLVNNAAAAPLGAFESISESEFETTLNLNVRSMFYLTQFLWRAWKEQSSTLPEPAQATPKTIVNISSLAAVDPFPQFSIYGASKAWLDLMTHALALEGRSLNIRVCSVRPGAVETPLLRNLFPDFPANQCATPESIADLVWNCVCQPNKFPSGAAFTLS